VEPAMASGEFVTVTSGSCNARVFSSDGDETRLDVYDAATTVTAWGHGMDFANAIASSDNDRIRASIVGHKSGYDNAAAGCPMIGSIDIKLSPGADFDDAATATVTVFFPFGSPWKLPVKMSPRRPVVRWILSNALRDCLRGQNGDVSIVPSATRPGDIMRLQIPRGFDPDGCTRDLSISAALEPNSVLDAPPDSLRWETVVTGLGAPAANPLTSACGRDDNCAPTAPFTMRPSWNSISELVHPSTRTIDVDVKFAKSTVLETIEVVVETVPERNPTATPPPPSVTVAAPFGGSVISAPTRIDCPRASCSEEFAENTVVGLTAVPDPGFVHTGWGGDCATTAPNTQCRIDNRLIRNANVSAQFTRVCRLSITKTGTGSGVVDGVFSGTTNAAGIACGFDCTEDYVCANNSVVELRPTPDPGMTFTGWTGACTGTVQPCVVSMNQNRNVTATFVAK